MKKVAVIGFGAAGIAALRVCKQFLKNAEIVAFESEPQTGGIWNYKNKENKEPHSSGPMYRSLRTNLPYQVMPYPDHPIPCPKDGSVFLTHQEVAQYLHDYCSIFDLYPNVRFNTKVQSVKRNEETNDWEIVSENKENQKTIEIFNYVIICSGHYSIPIIPQIDGIEKFHGEIMHSIDYDDATIFKNKNVIILGAAASGQDISLDISPHANQVYLSHSKELNTKFPENVHQVPSIVRCISENKFELENGEIILADYLLFCTGYKYDFPYLHKNCELHIEDGYISPLYYKLVNANHPSMFIIGMCRQVCPFPNFYIQARFVATVIEEPNKLPKKSDMLQFLEEEKNTFVSSGRPIKHLFVIENAQWDYNRLLASQANCDAVPLNIEKLYQDIRHIRRTRLTEYRKVKVNYDQEENDYKLEF